MSAASPRRRVFVWGAGRCATVIARALDGAGHTIVGTWNRTAEAATGQESWPRYHGARPAAMDEAEVVIVGVTDRALPAAAAQLAEHHVALHLAGAVPASVLRSSPSRPRAVACCHPLQSFPDRDASASHVRGIWFGVEGEPEACAVADALVADIGANSFRVGDETAKTLYHAACCVASNALVALADRAVTLFEGAGVTRAEALQALAPLIVGTANNLAKATEASEALTGPIHRGDQAVIAAHRAAIDARLPDERPIYDWVVSEVERAAASASAGSADQPLSEPGSS